MDDFFIITRKLYILNSEYLQSNMNYNHQVLLIKAIYIYIYKERERDRKKIT